MIPLKQKLKPVIQEPWWLIASAPDLTSVLPPLNQLRPYLHEINDHTIFQDAAGEWTLWACVRHTPVGRCLVNWRSGTLTGSPWKLTGEIIRCDRNTGESLVEWKGQEFLQSPFVMRQDGVWYMFYGGYDTGFDSDGNPPADYASAEKQICLMTSPDGRAWTRYKDAAGRSRVFFGPGATRDGFVTQFNGLWYMYYTGHLNRNLQKEVILCRTSNDLIHWSDCTLVHCTAGSRRSSHVCESPFVVQRDGFFYLFCSGGYTGDGNGSTAVFRSEDPLDFGKTGDLSAQYVCNISAHAPEIIADANGQEYISRIDNPQKPYDGIRLARLGWEKDV